MNDERTKVKEQVHMLVDRVEDGAALRRVWKILDRAWQVQA